MRNKVIVLLLIFLIACENKNQIKNSRMQVDAFKEKILDVVSLRKEFEKAFGINSKSKIFKVILSRRHNFMRITIFQIFYLNEIENDLPNDFFIYNNQVFLMFDGSEILYENTKKFEDIKKSVNNLNLQLYNSNVIYDSNIFQVDINLSNNVTINFPTISPYDERDNTENYFKPK